MMNINDDVILHHHYLELKIKKLLISSSNCSIISDIQNKEDILVER